MLIESAGPAAFCGRTFGVREISEIKEIVESFPGLSRTELAGTVCELLDWHRPNGTYKQRECREFLELLEAGGLFRLPARRPRRPRGSRTRVPKTSHGELQSAITGTVRDVSPVSLVLVGSREERLLWRELVGRYHYLGHKVPFGAHIRYLVRIAQLEAVVGCLQFSSPAWRMRPRDQWIGWDDGTRRRNLQQVASNSRFLILPWVRVRNLASTVLALAARQVAFDWEQRFRIRPVLIETLVDPQRYHGTSYKAANWIHVGMTVGRGRTDSTHRLHGNAPKAIFVYPLSKDARRRLTRV
jgi:hypothetical protein